MRIRQAVTGEQVVNEGDLVAVSNGVGGAIVSMDTWEEDGVGGINVTLSGGEVVSLWDIQTVNGTPLEIVG